MKPGDVVLVDTNVIIEAHDYGCWQSLVGAYTVETVETCVVEAMTGDGQRFEEASLRQSFHRIHEVSEIELVEVALRNGEGLDAGERALWAHALGRADTWVLCGPDRASMRFGYEQKMRDRVVSMGGLLNTINHRTARPLRPHFEQRWLDEVMVKLALGIL